ncbi:MAG: glycoside hydrolase family 3 N-terminal domain-containing protein [Calothrix sp. MO_167.B12]|nr:glycoside hydrolase family 3 N-terminal domain-containing protein [Calothrix sp. MO_167.B12]
MLPDIDKLSLAQQVAQMVVVRASGYLFDHQIQYPAWEPPAAKLKHWVQDLGIGGIIFLGASAGELAIRIQQLQDRANIPLLIAADIEEGVGQRFSGATWFPPPMALSAIFHQDQKLGLHYAEKMGELTAQEALAIGINWVLAPVVDVNNNPDNPVINVRAFGENTNEVKELACAFIRGTKKYPVITSAKHFPGHGDTAVDSHLELPAIAHSPTRLAEVELPPFQAAIAAGVDTVMSAHLLIPAWDQQLPATLSPQILTGKLRQQLGFSGLISTDALVMGAIANRYGANEAPVMAVEAGADILLMPADPEGAISSVCEAVESGRIERSRIRESVERIWQAKGKIAYQRTEVSNFTHQIASTEAQTTVKEILRHSLITHGYLPLSPAKFRNATQVNNSSSAENPTGLRNLIVVDDLLKCPYINHLAPAICLPTKMGYQTQICDHYHPNSIHFSSNYPTLLQLFIRGNPFRGSAGINQAAEDLLKKLLTDGCLQALIVYGSPYVWNQFIPLMQTETPGVFSYGQMPIAQETALLNLFEL